MKITEALALAQKHIFVSYAGGYYVSKPFHGLADAGGPTLAPYHTLPYHQAIAACRIDRITAVVEAVTGDCDYAQECRYEMELDPARSWFDDWRSQARHYVRKHREIAS